MCLITLATTFAAFSLCFNAFLPNKPSPNAPTAATGVPYLFTQSGHRPSLLSSTRVLLQAQHIFSSLYVLIALLYHIFLKLYLFFILPQQIV